METIAVLLREELLATLIYEDTYLKIKFYNGQIFCLKVEQLKNH